MTRRSHSAGVDQHADQYADMHVAAPPPCAAPQAYAQQFTPRVGRLVVHHPSHQHSHGPGSWKGLTVLKVGVLTQQQVL
jgi:hypothetical protein